MLTMYLLNVPPIYQRCPKDQTEQTCALRQYLNSKDSVYKALPCEHKLSPNTNNWTVVRDAIDEMHKICAKCQAEHNQNTK